MLKHSNDDDSVLQFLLGAAPLSSKASEQCMQTDELAAAPALTAAAKAAALCAASDGDDELLRDAPLLEYASDVESEDDYLDDASVAATAVRTMATAGLVCGGAGGSAHELSLPLPLPSSWALERGCEDIGDREDDPTADAPDEPSAAAAAAGGATASAPAATAAAADTDSVAAAVTSAATVTTAAKAPADNDADCCCCLSETSSNCTDSDGSLSDEVESEPCGLSDALPSGVHVCGGGGDASTDAADAVRECECGQPAAKQRDAKDTRTNHAAADASGRPQRQRPRAASSRSDRSPKKPRSAGAATPRAPATPAESVFVGAVALAMLLYVAAAVVAFVRPSVAPPLPPLASLQTPVDLSDVSLAITSPASRSLAQLPLLVQWELRAYPAAALAALGSEVFQYRIFVDGALAASEIGFVDAPGRKTKGDSVGALVTTRVQHRVPREHFPAFAMYELRVEVALPVPGSDGAVRTLEQRVVVAHALDLSRKLALVAPSTGAVFAAGQSVLVRYAATADVRRLRFVLDGGAAVVEKAQHSGSGGGSGDSSLLLRGLGVGAHSLALEGFDASGRRVASSGADSIAIDVV